VFNVFISCLSNYEIHITAQLIHKDKRHCCCCGNLSLLGNDTAATNDNSSAVRKELLPCAAGQRAVKRSDNKKFCAHRRREAWTFPQPARCDRRKNPQWY